MKDFTLGIDPANSIYDMINVTNQFDYIFFCSPNNLNLKIKRNQLNLLVCMPNFSKKSSFIFILKDSLDRSVHIL